MKSLRIRCQLFLYHTITLIAMRECPLTKEEMINVQKRIAEKKAAAQSEFYKKQLQ